MPVNQEKPKKIKFGTTLPADLLPRIRQFAEREGLYVDEIFASAIRLWLDGMEGRGQAYKPIHADSHRRLEAILESKDPALLEAVRGVLTVCERLLVTSVDRP